MRRIGLMIFLFLFLLRGVVGAVDDPKKMINIDPRVELTDVDYVTLVYRVLLNRDPDAGGFQLNMNTISGNLGRRVDVFSGLKNAPEFVGNPVLNSRLGYIQRVFQYVLKRTITQSEASGLLPQVPDDSNTTWYNYFLGVLSSPEYKSKNCILSYAQYQTPLRAEAPTLHDFVEGKARFQTFTESQNVNLTFPTSGETAVFGQKVSILKDLVTGKHFAFTRRYTPKNGVEHYVMYLMESTDGGITFRDVAPLFPLNSTRAYYDPHIAIDYSVCPTRYVMTMECMGEVCMSFSTTPFVAQSWSTPKVIVEHKSSMTASTGVTLVQDGTYYLSWTQLDDSAGRERAFSLVRKFSNMPSSKFYSDQGSVLLDAEANTHCTSAWDCNNRDKQDWKKEGSDYFLIYNGANYYRCRRPSGDVGTNQWGLAITMSSDPMGPYVPATQPIISAPDPNVCGISYPVMNNINGELFMYYAVDSDPDIHFTKRSKLVWKTGAGPTGTLVPKKQGDANNDGKVNIVDFSIWKTEYISKQGLTADFNNDGKVSVADFGLWRQGYLVR